MTVAIIGLVSFAAFCTVLVLAWQAALKAGMQEESLNETRKRVDDYTKATEAYKRAASLPDDDIRERLRQQAVQPPKRL